MTHYEYLSESAVAKLCGVTVATLRNREAELQGHGMPASHQFGRRRRWFAHEIHEWIERGFQAPAAHCADGPAATTAARSGWSARLAAAAMETV